VKAPIEEEAAWMVKSDVLRKAGMAGAGIEEAVRMVRELPSAIKIQASYRGYKARKGRIPELRRSRASVKDRVEALRSIFRLIEDEGRFRRVWGVFRLGYMRHTLSLEAWVILPNPNPNSNPNPIPNSNSTPNPNPEPNLRHGFSLSVRGELYKQRLVETQSAWHRHEPNRQHK